MAVRYYPFITVSARGCAPSLWEHLHLIGISLANYNTPPIARWLLAANDLDTFRRNTPILWMQLWFARDYINCPRRQSVVSMLG